MKLQLELTRTGSKIRAEATDDTGNYGCWATAETVDEAIKMLDLGGALSTTEPDPFGLNLAPDAEVPKPTRVEREVAVEGDSEAMRTLFEAAILDKGKVQINYTTETGQTGVRIVVPFEMTWLGANTHAPRRAVRAYHEGILKSFYLHRISRAERV